MVGEVTTSETPSPVLIGMRAPDFEASTTQGKVSLSQFKGKWVVLFSHPADFTPVCTTEFISFTQKYDEFKRRNVQLIGLSVDSVPSHIAWVMNIKEKMGIDVPFPIIADLHKDVSRKYGMIHSSVESDVTVRSVFFIDPEHILRAIIYYPKSTGRNMDEILRVIDSLQLVDKEKIATPANWKPGDPVVMPPPGTVQSAMDRLKEGCECKDWYYCTKRIE